MIKTIKVWWSRIIRSKTMWFSILLAVLGVIQASMDVFTPYISPQSMGGLTLLIGILVAVLRVLTHNSLEDK